MRRGRGFLSLIDPGTQEDEEGPLVERARAGELDAWHALHDRHRPLVLGFIRKLGGDEDEFQETFLRAFRAIASFEPGRPFAAWLVSIARNVVIDVHRRSKGKPVMQDLERLQDTTRGDRPDEVAAAAELLERALASLNAFERRLLRLRHGEGKSVAETAAALGCDENKVKNTMHRVLSRFYGVAGKKEDDRGLSR